MAEFNKKGQLNDDMTCEVVVKLTSRYSTPVAVARIEQTLVGSRDLTSHATVQTVRQLVAKLADDALARVDTDVMLLHEQARQSVEPDEKDGDESEYDFAAARPKQTNPNEVTGPMRDVATAEAEPTERVMPRNGQRDVATDAGPAAPFATEPRD